MAEINLRRTFLGGLTPDENQTDVAHMIYFAIHGLPLNFIRRDDNEPIGDLHLIEDKGVCGKMDADESLECKAEHHYGSWFESLASMESPPSHVAAQQQADFPLSRLFAEEQSVAQETVYIESLMLCPQPKILNTGPHRAVAAFWLSGERYGIAFEEGGGPSEEVLRRIPDYSPLEYLTNFIATSIDNSHKENVFIEGLTPGAKIRAKDMRYVEDIMIPSVVYAMTGYRLYRTAHDFVIDVYGGGQAPEDSSPSGHWFNGCTPSDKMYTY